jgi:hypothetical protein
MDFDNSFRIDSDDFAQFQSALSGPGTPPKGLRR